MRASDVVKVDKTQRISTKIDSAPKFGMELRKIEEKDKVRKTHRPCFKSEKQLHLQMFFKIVFLKILQISQENNYVGVSFSKVAGLKRSGTLLKRDSNTDVFL